MLLAKPSVLSGYVRGNQLNTMVFNADESESDDCLGEEDRELAYREEEAELAELKKQRK